MQLNQLEECYKLLEKQAKARHAADRASVDEVRVVVKEQRRKTQRLEPRVSQANLGSPKGAVSWRNLVGGDSGDDDDSSGGPGPGGPPGDGADGAQLSETFGKLANTLGRLKDDVETAEVETQTPAAWLKGHGAAHGGSSNRLVRTKSTTAMRDAERDAAREALQIFDSPRPKTPEAAREAAQEAVHLVEPGSSALPGPPATTSVSPFTATDTLAWTWMARRSPTAAKR